MIVCAHDKKSEREREREINRNRKIEGAVNDECMGVYVIHSSQAPKTPP